MIDIHCHGGGGFYFSDPNIENIKIAIDTHKRSGTKQLLTSLVTDTIENLKAQITRLIPFYERGEIAGIHLEGPYLSHNRCGAHEPTLLRLPDLNEVKPLLDIGSGAIAMVTIAPELPGAIEVIKYLEKNGITAAIGHTDGDAEDAAAAIDAGASVVTHFTNAMSKLRDGKNSFAQRVFDDSRIALELIVDGVHVPFAEVLEIFEKAPGRIILISDAMSAAGKPDGDYKIGPLDVEVSQSIARLKSNGALAGSTLTLARAAENAIKAGVPKELVDHATTSAPKLLLNV
mgnify:FL=1